MAAYNRCLALAPGLGEAYWSLANLKTVRFTAGEVAAMLAQLERADLTLEDRFHLHYALGKALEDAGDWAASFAHYAEGARLRRSELPYEATEATAQVGRSKALFTRDFFAQHAEVGDASPDPIFVVGLPRSGSTLVEQILASHSSVEGAGELPDLPQVLGEESRRRGQPFPQWVHAMQPADWERLGRRYLERTAHWRRQRPVFTDKLPNNWMYTGAIRAMLPGARIIACRRDPLETCFSCYRQYLAGNEYTRTFDDLATFWHDFDRSVRHWHMLHPSQVFEHEYEQLLADPEAHIRRLLDFCGLPFEPACLSFHENQREVRSPSATQVRQPLHDTARAPRYGALLDPLRIALGLPPWQQHGSP